MIYVNYNNSVMFAASTFYFLTYGQLFKYRRENGLKISQIIALIVEKIESNAENKSQPTSSLTRSDQSSPACRTFFLSSKTILDYQTKEKI